MRAANGIPLLPPRRPLGADYKIDIPPGSELDGPARSTGYFCCLKAEIRGVGFVHVQVSRAG